MAPLPLRTPPAVRSDLSADEAAIARSVLYAALFDYPLTLAQLRQTLIASRQTPGAILSTFRRSPALASLIEHRDGFFFPAGRIDLIETRRRRELRSRAFLAAHRPLLRLIAALPYVRLVALSGSIAHLNLEAGGDLDLFIVTRGPRVWSTTVATVLLAKLLRRRRTLCANFVVADTALAFEPPDLFTASQVINLKPLTGDALFREIVAANPFVRTHYPNFHLPDSGGLGIRQSSVLRACKRVAEVAFLWPSAFVEGMCRRGYRQYLRGRASTWESPDQVTLGDTVLKLHTRSHRARVMREFDRAVHDRLET
jgi:hypothetical protein